MSKLAIIIAAILVLSVVVFAFARHSSITGPVIILDSLKSGDTEQNVRQILATYKLYEKERTPENQYHKSHVVLGTDGYQTSNCSGKLLLQFYDGGLYDVWFYPDDFNAYQAQLRKEGIDLDQTSEIRTKGLKIWSMRDSEAKQYVGREDLEIGRKIEDITD